MANNIWLVAELTIAQGKTETFKERMQTLIELVHSNEPDTLVFKCYLNDEETKCYPFELYRDSEALQAHLKNVSEIFPRLMEVSQLTRIEIYGDATEELKKSVADLGAEVFKHWNGFTRET